MAEELDVSDILQEENGVNEEEEDDDDEEAMTAPEVLQKLEEVWKTLFKHFYMLGSYAKSQISACTQ